jgi:hypothetical protein
VTFAGADNRLSENEAVEEIKQLAKQLQSLYDRIPQRGPATNVILTLLDICRASQTQNSGALTLKPPSKPHEQAPKPLAICNGSSCGGVVDKETNTSFDNLVWQQLNDASCRAVISEKCDNRLGVKEVCGRKSKCCEANNTTQTINCSTSSINFDNLQLQCMCSSDNNSLDEYQIDNCDNCSANSPPRHPTESLQSQSFRERLLNIARPDDRTNNLRKRNSELVLGTNFDSASMSGYKGSQNYRISCDNIFSNRQPALTTRETSNNKSNHSLSTESDRITQIPYSFLERPTMKMSQSEDRNLRELKIALSSSLPSANKINNSSGSKNKLIGNLKSAQITNQSQSCTSSSSTSSKVDKVSTSLSATSTSDAILTAVKKAQENDTINADMRIMTDETNKQRETESINNQNDNKSKEDNKMIMATSKLAADNKTSTTPSNVNNKGINNTNGGAKKRKTPEGKLAIDLNDRSKYTDEVSV